MVDDQKMRHATEQRMELLLKRHHAMLHARVDWLFAGLLLIQVLLAGAAILNRVAHPVADGVLSTLGAAGAGAVVLATLSASAICTLFAGRKLTCHVAAAGQLLACGLFIALSAGQGVAYFYLFASVAMLALYRDQRVLLTTAIISVGELIALHQMIPGAVAGVFTFGAWRWLELGGGIILLNLVCGFICHLSHHELASLIKTRSQYEIATEMLPSAKGQLEQSEERFRSLSASSPIGIFQTDSDNRCIYTNQRWTDLTGLTMEESLGANWLQAVHQDDRKAFLTSWSTAASQGAEFGGDFRLNPSPKFCGEGWMRSRANAIRHEGVITGYVGTIEDITEQKQVQLQMQTAKETAEAASRAKSEFLANMSHEIRTPMTAILGYADLMLNRTLPAEEQSKYMRTIRQNGYHLLTVINDILDISKIEAGRMTVERIACSPHLVVSDVVAMMRGRALERKLNFELEYRTALPKTIETDPTRLRQIIMNLVGNAIKFTERGSVRLAVSLVKDLDGHKHFLRVDVIDTGIGLSVEQRVKLLMPFAQADTSTTRKYGGTGLGLVISMRLAEMLGGGISIQSTPGQGSTFTIQIDTGSLVDVPMVSDPQEVHQQVQTTNEPEAVSYEGRVLVAEDGLDNQQLILFYLQEAGLSVELVNNGRIALEKVQAAAAEGKPYQAVLMDMQMPEMDGYEATRQIRSLGYGGKIIALTAHAMHGDRQKCLDAGCDDYLTKPIAWDQLFKMLKSAVKQRQTKAEIAAAPSGFAIKDSGKVQKLVKNFLTRLPQRMVDLDQALTAGDVEKIKVLAHQLKGAAAGYGFPEISEASRVLEESAKAGDPMETIKSLAHALEGLCSVAAEPSAV